MNAGKTRMRRRGFSLFGLLLVAIGAVLLLNTTSVLPFGIWFELVDFWPVLLVIIGAKIMLAPRWPLVGAGLVALIIVGTVTAASLTLPPYQNRGPLRVTYVEPLADTEILRLSMGFAGGRVELTSDPASVSRYPRLLAADFGNRPARVIHDQTGRLTKIYLSTEGTVIEFASEDGYARDAPGSGSDGLEASFSVSGIVDWHLMVSPDVAVDLEIKAGAADLDLDLRDLKVRRLVVGAGASDIRILLPTDAGQTDVEIAAGVTDIEILVPRGVAAHITSDAFFNSTSIDTARFPDTRDGHRSPDYYNAENRVSIEIDAVAADITIS